MPDVQWLSSIGQRPTATEEPRLEPTTDWLSSIAVKPKMPDEERRRMMAQGSQLTPEERSQMLEGEPPPSYLDTARTGIMRGLVGDLYGSRAKGVSALAAGMENIVGDAEPASDGAFYGFGQALQDFVKEYYSADPRLEGTFWADAVPRGLGQAAGYAGEAYLTRGNRAVPAVGGALQEAGSLYEEAIQAGATEDQAQIVAALGVPLGATEALGLGGMFSKWAKPGSKPVTRSLIESVKSGEVKTIAQGLAKFLETPAKEAAQEYGQTVGENVALKQTGAIPDRAPTEGALESAGVGAIVGKAGDILTHIAKPPVPRETPFAPTREYAKEYAATNPEGAKTLVQALERSQSRQKKGLKGATVSIADFEKAGIYRGKTRTQSGQRTVFANFVKEELENAAQGTGGEVAGGIPQADIEEAGAQQVRGDSGEAVGQVQEEVLRPTIKQRATKARQEFDQSLLDFGKYLEGRQFSNPLLDPELIKHTVNVVAKGVKAGALKFADVVNDLANSVGVDRARRLGPLLREQWAKSRETNPALDEPGDVDEILKSRTDAGKMEPIGRPYLANPAVEISAREFVDVVDEQRNQAGAPAPRPREVAEQQATEALKDYTGTKKKIIASVKAGQALNEAETVAARRIVETEALNALRSANESSLKEAVDVAWSYREARAEQARTLSLRDPVEPATRRKRSILEGILTPPQKQIEAIESAIKRGDSTKAESLRATWAKEIIRLRKKLKALGVDPDSIDDVSKDPVKSAKAIGTIQTVKADNWDKAYEYWRNAILSAPITQSANVVGNITNAAWSMSGERLASAAWAKLTGNKKGAQFGEFKRLLSGFLPGLSRGARNALLAWKTETPYFEQSLGREGTTKFEEPNVAIEGAKGKIIRIPQRLLLLADEFSKSVTAQMEVGAQAYRIANSEGLSGDTLENRIRELIADPNSDAWDQALHLSSKYAFQEPQTKIGQKVTKLALQARKDIPGLRYVMPFITTPVGIFEAGLKPQRLLVLLTLLVLLDNDDDEPWITGSTPAGKTGPRDLSRRTYPPQSIRIGDKWVSYARIEPLATTLGIAVDWANAVKSKDPESIAKTPAQSVLGQIGTKTFLSGLADIIEATQGTEASLDKIAKWGSNFATSWVPNAVRSASRNMDDVIPERSVWGKGTEWNTRLLRRTIQKTELGVIDDQPAVDLWGREAKRSGSPIPRTDWLYRMLVPAEVKTPDIVSADRVLLNWNNEHPEDEKFPLPPSKSYTLDGKTKYFTDEQYAKYAKLAGEGARKTVDKFSLHTDDPTTADIDIIEKAISQSRALAKSVVLGEKSLSSDEIGDQVRMKIAYSAFDAATDPPLKRKDKEIESEYISRRKERFKDQDAAKDIWERADVGGADIRREHRKRGLDASSDAFQDRLKRLKRLPSNSSGSSNNRGN